MINKEKIAVNYLGLLENLVYPKRELEQDIDVLFFGRIVTNLGSMVFPLLTLILSIFKAMQDK